MDKKVESIRQGWELTTWTRELPYEGERLPPKRRAALAAKLQGEPDERKVALSAGELRLLLAMTERPRERGARIKGLDENGGVVYLATVDPENPRRLRTVEVIATDEIARPDVFRVPVRLIEDLTRYVLARQDASAAESGDDPSEVLSFEVATVDGTPTAETLLDLKKQGVTASGIGKIYGRSEERVYQWLRRAQTEYPDLDWPAARRGPRPNSTDGTRPSGTKKRGEAR